MKKYAFLLLVLLLGAATSYSQHFAKFYAGGASRDMNLFELSSGSVVAGIGSIGYGISLIDVYGSLTETKYWWTDSTTKILSMRKATDNDYYFVIAYLSDTCYTNGPWVIPYNYPAICRMDSLGNKSSVHFYKFVSPECHKVPKDLALLDDGSVLTWGDEHLFALRVDSSGAVIWAKDFGNTGGFDFIRELPGGDLLAGINMDNIGAVVGRMDAMGNFLWLNSYIRPDGVVRDCIIESDSSFVITGFTDNTTSHSTNMFMMKLNGNGDVHWCKGYDGIGKWASDNNRIERTQDGNYIILARNGYWPFLMKTDLNGDTLWTRGYGRTNYSYVAVDLLAVSDGGFMFDGAIYGNLPNGLGAPYIYKTDSMGYMPCWNRNIEVELLNLFPTDSAVTLTSVDGAVMYTATLNDTVFDPVVTYDGCTFTTGLPDEVRRARGMSVRPNPNPGQFTVVFKDPLEADSFYSVYDELGRLLYQRPLPTGEAQEEIDLSRFGKGMYVLQVTDPEGVRVERVVVE